MGKTGKVTTLLLIVFLATSSLMAIKSASGTTNLSAPKFTVKLVAYPYDVPTSYNFDSTTGEKITFQGYHVENCSIEITIKNPTKNQDCLSYFEIETKNHDNENWNPIDGHYNTQPPNFAYLASPEEYTVVSYGADYTVDTKLDFQVKAYYGKTTWYNTPGYPLRSYSTFEIISSSPWSPIQTITIGEPEYRTTSTETENKAAQQTTTELPPTEATTTQTDTVEQASLYKVLFGLEWKDIAVVLLAVLVAVLVTILMVFYRRACIKGKNPN